MNNEEEMLYRATVLKNQSEQLENTIQSANEQIKELEELNSTLSLIKNGEKQVLNPIGKGIYLKANIENDELFVNVGSNIVVKKTIPEGKKMIEEQTSKLRKASLEISMQLQQYAMEFQHMLKELNKIKEEQ